MYKRKRKLNINYELLRKCMIPTTNTETFNLPTTTAALNNLSAFKPDPNQCVSVSFPMLADPINTFNDLVKRLKFSFTNNWSESFGKNAGKIKKRKNEKYLDGVFPESAYVEPKLDGERVLCKITNGGSNIKFYSRTLKEFSDSNKLLTFFGKSLRLKTPYQSCVLDCERVYLKESNFKKPNINDNECDTLLELLPICDTGCREYLEQALFIFDIQQLDGVSLFTRPLFERKRLLDEIFDEPLARDTLLSNTAFDLPCNVITFKRKKNLLKNDFEWCRVFLVDYRTVNDLNSVKKIFNESVSSNNGSLEGLMIKPISSLYISNSRQQWTKLKSLHLLDNRLEIDLLVSRIEKDKDGLLSILVCGYYTDLSDNNIEKIKKPTSKFVEVCRVSSGISDSDRVKLNLLLASYEYLKSNENNVRFIVTVTFDRITRGKKSLRHPVFRKFVHDKLQLDIDSLEKLKAVSDS